MIDHNRIAQALAELKSQDPAVRQAAIDLLNEAINEPELDDTLRLKIMTELAALGSSSLPVDTAPELDFYGMEDDLESIDDEDSDALWLDHLAASKNPNYQDDEEGEAVPDEDHSEWLESLARRQGFDELPQPAIPDKLSSMTDVLPSEFVNDIIQDMRAVNEIPEWLNDMLPSSEINPAEMRTEEFDVDDIDTAELPDWLREHNAETLDIFPEEQKTESDLQERVHRSFGTTDILPVAPQLPVPPSTDADRIQFAAYHPRTIQPQAWESFYAYVFHASAGGDVFTDAMRALGDNAGNYNTSAANAFTNIPRGAIITATPYVPGFQFYPLAMTIQFDEAWSRFDFKVKAKIAQENQFETGRVTFSMDGIIVADVPVAMYVGATPRKPEVQSNRNPLYTSIFCSYSHADSHIVERLERVYQALGIEYLRDITSLRSGTRWSEALLSMIDRADVFQLFWSRSAAQSPHVRQEYEHALKHERQRYHFIRPVCWENPAPPIPAKLSHIHFAYRPELLALVDEVAT